MAEGGDVVGMYEALSGRFMTSHGTVATAGSALRIDRADLFELMADNIPLLQGIFSGLLHASAATPADTHADPAPAGASVRTELTSRGRRTSKMVPTPRRAARRSTRAAVAFDDRLDDRQAEAGAGGVGA